MAGIHLDEEQPSKKNKAKTKKKGLSLKATAPALRSTEVVEEPCMGGPRRKVRYAIL